MHNQPVVSQVHTVRQFVLDNVMKTQLMRDMREVGGFNLQVLNGGNGFAEGKMRDVIFFAQGI